MNDLPDAVNAADLPDSALPAALFALLRQRIESRYRRLLFVHKELVKIDRAAQQAVPAQSGSFEDFVFNRIDFSIYKKIDAEEFRLLFDEGLADFEDAFYQKYFSLDRSAVRHIISEAYTREGSFYLLCKNASPLLLSIMRTVNGSLEFAPLLTTEEIAGIAIKLLDGLVIRHRDGMETKLFTEAGSVLRGTFYPLGKACTITLMKR